MEDRMAHGKTKRRLDILNSVPGIVFIPGTKLTMSISIIREIIKALPRRTPTTFASSIKHLLECK